MFSRFTNSIIGGREFKRGNSLFKQKKYADAEQLFRQSIQKREKVLGKEHEDTLFGKHWLARTLYKQKKYTEAEQLFRQSVPGLEKVLGREDKYTLFSKHWLARTLYEQVKYIEAEQLFRQSVQGLERVQGMEYEETLLSKDWLARTLYEQKKYVEAEQLFRQLVPGLEKVLGKEHKDTILSKDWLARTLYIQEKYTEAEQLFQQSVQGLEQVLGKEHKDTLLSKHWLARTLYMQKNYAEAEQLFRHSVQEREKVLGKEHEDTLFGKHWLARTLYKQKKYTEAEQLFRQSVPGLEKVLGKEHKDTIISKDWLARTLYIQKNYTEAEQLFRQSVQEQEKVLGKEDKETLLTKYWLARTLYKQEMYAETEKLLRQLTQELEKALGKEHKDTIEACRLLQEMLLVITPPTSVNPTPETVLSRLSHFFVEDQKGRTQYTDSEIRQITLLLNHLNPQWSKTPRTYITLRTIGCLDLLNTFIDLGFTDYWFPVTERNLPHCLRPSHRSRFLDAQKLVITTTMDLEKGEEGQHCYLSRNEPLPFEVKGILGSGGFGQVDKVLSIISFREYARKRVRRSVVFGGRRTEEVKQFVAEIEILKRLKHHHVVEFVGSYTDSKYMGLIMSPVADMDLCRYLEQAESARYGELRTFFGCLATALEFLHEQGVRHKDIKPGNILIHGGNVLVTDFGLSLDFTNATGSTTVSMVNGMTARYCAPEVAMQEPRNTSSDVWSLGAVFLEMIVVLKGRTVEYMYEFLMEHGSQRAYIHSNQDGCIELIAELRGLGNMTENAALTWVQDMLQTMPKMRPTAASIVGSITAASKEGVGNGVFCGICCLSGDDFSDDAEEFSD